MILNKSAVPKVVVEMTKLLEAERSRPRLNLTAGVTPDRKTIWGSLVVEEVAAVIVNWEVVALE